MVISSVFGVERDTDVKKATEELVLTGYSGNYKLAGDLAKVNRPWRYVARERHLS